MVNWEQLENLCSSCTRCGLCQTRNNTVFDGGSRNAKIMLVGEGPGRQEDLQGKVFVGPAGQLLDKMLASINLTRDDVYISNVVKCRPPQNRDPRPAERVSCLPYLRAQLVLVKPKIIVCLGRVAAQAIIKPDFRITTEHGIWTERAGYFMTATYHPAALLRYPDNKRAAYEDLLKIREKLDSFEQETDKTDKTD